MDKSQVDAIIVAQFFVSQSLFSEIDTSIKMIKKFLGINDADYKHSQIDLGAFQKLLCRPIFKQSLLDVIQEIEEKHGDVAESGGEKIEGEALGQQILQFQRSLILDFVKEKLQRNLGKIEPPLKQLSSTMGKNIVNAISKRHLAKDKMYFK